MNGTLLEPGPWFVAELPREEAGVGVVTDREATGEGQKPGRESGGGAC